MKKVSLELGSMNVQELVSFGLLVVSRMTGNVFFPTPTPTLVVLTKAINELQIAFNKAQEGTKRDTADLHVKRGVVETLLTQESNHVENVANDAVNVNTGAEVIILSAGMRVKRVAQRQKQVFTVEPKKSGTVLLTAKSAKRGAHEWQYATSLTEPVAWIDAPPSLKASILLTGLSSGVKYHFRHRLVLKEGPAAWDAPESTVVL